MFILQPLPLTLRKSTSVAILILGVEVSTELLLLDVIWLDHTYNKCLRYVFLVWILWLV